MEETKLGAARIALKKRSKVGLYSLLGVLVAFIVGYLIPISGTRSLREDVDRQSDELVVLARTATLEATGERASTAALYVATGDYEGATRHATAFFDGLSSLRADLTEIQGLSLDSLTVRRDDIMQLVRAKDDLALYQLLDVYSRFQASLLGRERIFTDPRFR